MAHNVWVLCYTPYQAKSVKDVEEGTLALAVHRMLHIYECVDSLPGFSHWVQYSNKRPTHNTQTIITTSFSFWSIDYQKNRDLHLSFWLSLVSTDLFLFSVLIFPRWSSHQKGDYSLFSFSLRKDGGALRYLTETKSFFWETSTNSWMQLCWPFWNWKNWGIRV